MQDKEEPQPYQKSEKTEDPGKPPPDKDSSNEPSSATQRYIHNYIAMCIKIPQPKPGGT